MKTNIKKQSAILLKYKYIILCSCLITFTLNLFQGFNCFAQPTDPPVPTVNTPSCGLKYLTVSAPPSGVTYYWQGTNCAANSTTDNATSPYTVSYYCTSSIIYYVKARDNSTGQWSAGCGSADVGVPRNPVPCQPSDPTTTTTTCGNQTLTRVGTPPTDVLFYWQGTDSAGTDMTNSAPTYIVTATGTYYIRAYDQCSGQWSASSGSIVSTINNPLPAAPLAPTVSNPTSCGELKILTEAAPPAGVTYYWQGTNSNGTDATNNASSPYTVSYSCTSSMLYYVRTKSDSGCWSENSGSVDIGSPRPTAPCTPSNPSTTNNTCGNQTLTRIGTPPTDVLFYWQGTDSAGTDMTNSAPTYTVTATGTYYIRAYDKCNGQWSASSGSVASTINNPLPAAPPAPTVSNPTSCGELKILTEVAPPAGVTYYWQGTNSNGTDATNNASSPYTVSHSCTSSMLYYVRSKNNAGCWSSSSGSVDVGTPRSAEPCTPSNPSTTNESCGNQTLTRVGTPPTDVLFYWQGTDSAGTDMTNSAPTYTVTTTGTYYIRAYDQCNGQWSASYGSVVSTIVNLLPATPPTPTVNNPSCGSNYLTITAPPSGVTYYWQGTNSSGTDMSNSTSNFSVSDNCTWATYYIRARSNAGCWSANSVSPSIYECNPTPCPSCSIVASAGNDTSVCKGETIVLTASGGTKYLWDTGDTTASVTVSPTTNTFYNVTVSNDSCSNKATVKVNVDTMPEAAITGITTICKGYTSLLTASGVGTYVWNTGSSNNSITVAPSQNTTYIVTVFNGACSDVDSLQMTVNTVVASIIGKTIICGNESTTLTASGGTNYLWNTSDTTASITVSPVSDTTYRVTVTDSCGSDTETVAITVKNCTGINQLSVNDLWMVHPNPSDGNFELEITNYELEMKNTNVIIYNVLGEKVYQQTLNTKQKTINTKLSKGIYILKIQDTEKIMYQKVIIE